MPLSVALARRMMLAFPHSPPRDNPWLWELVQGNPELVEKQPVESYKDENSYPFHNYFGHTLPIQGQNVLDLGCYCGGKAVAWLERYRPASIAGIDTHPTMIAAARKFAASKGLSSRTHFEVGFAEEMPFSDASFDAIVSFDVLEHVRSVEGVLRECCRILRPGGRMYLVFPTYFHPVEHHLGIVTQTPCVQWFFSGRTMLAAFNQIVAERGDNEYVRPPLEPWERWYTLNGVTVGKFDGLVRDFGLITVERIDPPLFRAGRNAVQFPFAKGLSVICGALQHLGPLKECVTHRVVRVLEKPHTQPIVKSEGHAPVHNQPGWSK
jgi:SAM-dependent methyltransferase